MLRTEVTSFATDWQGAHNTVYAVNTSTEVCVQPPWVALASNGRQGTLAFSQGILLSNSGSSAPR
eukprot:500797-Pyramimonas_sp.AAC.2